MSFCYSILGRDFLVCSRAKIGLFFRPSKGGVTVANEAFTARNRAWNKYQHSEPIFSKFVLKSVPTGGGLWDRGSSGTFYKSISRLIEWGKRQGLDASNQAIILAARWEPYQRTEVHCQQRVFWTIKIADLLITRLAGISTLKHHQLSAFCRRLWYFGPSKISFITRRQSSALIHAQYFGQCTIEINTSLRVPFILYSSRWTIYILKWHLLRTEALPNAIHENLSYINPSPHLGASPS